MSLEEEREFWDMTPHRITVTSYGKRNNQGRKELDPSTARTYRCLISVNSSLSRGIQVVEETVGVNAYCLATPIVRVEAGEEVNGPETVRIDEEDKVEFVNPAMESRPIKSVEMFYDETGLLHNMLVHFS
ncbi:hypothetical protein [Streptomyces sp. NPDC006477]|uniref:hypothetical protein n=1 Tax=Streptomyces sp. NPDC006477 TaxID=3364747 RepID=UPI0036C7A410